MSFDVIRFLSQKGLLNTGGDFAVEKLLGGYWNDNFRVTGSEVDWVVKRNRKGLPGESLFPNLPEAEASALECLRGANVAPTPLAFFPEDGPVLVYEFWPGKLWSDGVLEVAELLLRLHTFRQPETSAFRLLPISSQDILQQGDEMLPVADPLSDRLRPLRPDPSSTLPLPSRKLIHTDVGAGNIIVGPSGARLIDWQCPGLGDPAEDIWAFLSPSFQILFDHAPLHDRERDDFLSAYGGQETIERMVSLSSAFGYRMAAYCCLRGMELERQDPDLSRKYRKAALAEIAALADSQA